MVSSRDNRQPNDRPRMADFNPLNSDFSFGRIAEDIIGLFMGAQSNGRERIRGEIEKLLQKMEIVTRREFEAVREIAIAARTQAEELAERLDGKKPAVKKAPAKKAPAKKSPAKNRRTCDQPVMVC